MTIWRYADWREIMTDLRTQAIVLSRIKYQESDRILTLLTPEGRFSAIARGVRKERSKLAGSIEPFTVSDVVLHFKSQNPDSGVGLAILTSATMLKFYQNIITDLDTLTIASNFLKVINRLTNDADSKEYFQLLKNALSALNTAEKYQIPLVETHFYLNLTFISGEMINLASDSNGDRLTLDGSYNWHSFDRCFVLVMDGAGEFNADTIKILRLMTSMPVATILKIKDIHTHLNALNIILRTLREMF